jgi:holliday junction DNA helicase RuvB
MRVKTLEEFVGQADLKDRLRLAVKGFKGTGGMEHILLSGMSGGGKTTLAHIIGDMIGWEVFEINCSSVNRGSYIPFLKVYENRDKKFILFLDEIHRLPIAESESLYRVMEERKIEKHNIQFCIIGATNRVGSLPEPLVNRFGIIHYLDKYTLEELESVVKVSEKFIGSNGDPLSLRMIARACRGTPRIAQSLLREVSNYRKNFKPADVIEVFRIIGIDLNGLSKIDMRYLKGIEKMGNKPIGLKTLESIVNETAETIETKIEPTLLEMGLIERSPRGRLLTSDGLKYIGSDMPSMGDIKKMIGG